MNQLNRHSVWNSPIDRFFDDFWAPGLRTAPKLHEGEWHPACDVEEADHHYLVSVEMPGVAKDAIKLEVLGDQLTITGERRAREREESEGVRYSERSYGKFSRSFALPKGVDAEKIEANYEDGVLQVYVPKAEAAKPRSIKIGAGAVGEGGGFFSKLLGSDRRRDDHVA